MERWIDVGRQRFGQSQQITVAYFSLYLLRIKIIKVKMKLSFGLEDRHGVGDREGKE